MLLNESTENWLQYRFGNAKADKEKFRIRKKALELNRNASDIINNCGNTAIRGFVGFIDLIGFSSRMCNHSPKSHHKYLQPFLDGIVDSICGNYGVVDKTIGDEVMFAFFDEDEDGGAPSVIFLARALSRIYRLSIKLGNDYPFRIGLSYGELYLGRVGNELYSEWTLHGETIILAKRLHSLDGLKEFEELYTVFGAFGILNSLAQDKLKLEKMLYYIAGPSSKFGYKEVENSKKLRGVSEYTAMVFYPKSMNE